MKIRCVKSCSTVRPFQRGWQEGQTIVVPEYIGEGLLRSPNFEEVEERSEYKTRELKVKRNG